MADFYYRYNNGGDTLLLNDAYMGQSIPVTSGLHRRFMAENFSANVWKDSITAATVNSTNMTLVSRTGNKQYRTTNAVQFGTNGSVIFGNSALTNYTLFFITRYTGGTKARILNGTTNNCLYGHWSGNAGVSHHDSWLTPQVDVHGNNFFIGRDTGTSFFTNGVIRSTMVPILTSLVGLQINSTNAYEPSDGQLLDLVIYNRELTDIEKRKVEHYLASYYGILDKVGSLTAFHNRAPLSTETSLLVSSLANRNWIQYPSFHIAQTGLTFAMWFKMNGLQDNARLMDFGNGQGVNNIIIASNPTGGIQLAVYTPTVGFGGGGQLTPNYTDDKWRHLVWTISADGVTWKLYINKVLLATIDSSNYSSYGGSSAPNHPASILRTLNYIGLDNFGGSSILKGSVEDFQMYNYPLDHTAINKTWNMDTGEVLLPKYARPVISTETSMLVSTAAYANSIIYPAFTTAQTGFTFALWFKANSTPSNSRLFDFGNGQAVNNIFLYFNGKNLSLGVQTSSTSFCILNDVILNCNDNTWRHFVWTISADGLTWKLYINGVLQVTINSSNFTTYRVSTSVAPYHPDIVLRAVNYIGKSNWSADASFIGSIDDFQMYNSPLELTAINQKWNMNTYASIPMLDFYYRYNRNYSNMILNDASLGAKNPVLIGLHRRFKAEDFNPVTKIWVDSVGGTTVTATGTATLVQHGGDKHHRPANVVQFSSTDTISFNNDVLPNYTVFAITRFTGPKKHRVINGIGAIWFSGHHDSCSGVAYHEGWLTSYTVDVHGTNFFIGTDTASSYSTNGVVRGTATPGITYLPKLAINLGDATPSQNSDCQVLDLLMYNRVLSETERKKVEHYLASYYGLLDLSGNLTANYNRVPLSIETSLLVSSAANPNFINYPAFTINQTGLTFSMWFRSNGTATSGRLFDFGNGPGVNIILIAIHENKLSIYMIDVDSCDLKIVYSNANNLGVNDNVWRHLVWTISVDGLTWNIYINKVLLANITSSNYTNYTSTGTRGPFHPSSVLRTSNYIGKSNWSVDPQFIGAIDEFQMFNYALDQNAINSLYTVNTLTTMTVNLDQGSLAVPIPGTSFLSSNPSVATVTGSTLTLLTSGTTTIISNLNSTANPVQLVLTVIKNGIGYISGKDLIEQIDMNSIQTLTIQPTMACQTLSLSTKNLYAKQLQLSLDGVSNVGDTSVTFGKPRPNLWVAIGSGTNTMAYSSDGINWNVMGSSIFSQGRGLAWNGRIWVAGGDGGGTNTLGYSYDGITWTGLGSSIFNTGAYDFAWSGTLWVAGGGNSGTNTIAYSYDGVNWIGRGNMINVWVNSVACNGRMFVAVGNGTVNMMYSYDGINWTANNSSLFTQGGCVRWNGTMWVAGGGINTSTTYIAYSYDGITWNSVSNSKTLINHNNGLIGLAWNGTLWVGTCGGTGCTNSIIYSYDGINWIGLGTSIFSNYPYSITWNGQMFMACGVGTNTMAYSYDGVNWVGLGASLFSTICYAAVNNVAYENRITARKRLMIAAGEGTNTLAYSYDGIQWKGLGNSIFSNRCYSIRWNGTLWVATGYNNNFGYSYDGINWVTNTANNIMGLGICIAWNGSIWVAGGVSGTNTFSLASSSDGKTWTGRNKTVISDTCYAVATNGKIWIALGIGTNSIAYSYDGISWTGLGVSIFTTGMCAYWNGFMFVAGGTGNNQIAYSYDGLIWIGLGNIFTTTPHDVAHNGTMWVMVGGQTGAYSYDGKSWKLFDLPFFTGVQYAGAMYLSWNGSLWVVVGGSSTSQMAYSSDGFTWSTIPNKIFTNWGTGIGSDWTGQATTIQLYQSIVACGQGTNTLAYSQDGLTWTGLGNSIFTTSGDRARWNGRMWVAGGKGTTNTMAYSYDGKNWIGLGNTVFNTSCEALYWTGSLWLAGGSSADSNTMAYSYNGINWTGLGRTIFTGACYGYGWNGTLYVAGGFGTNSLAYSYDGIQWTPITNHPFTVVDEVLWSGTLWVASGSAGVAYSYDGLNWAVGTSIGIRGQSVAYNGSMFVVIGGNSASWYSYDGILWIQGSIGFTSGTSRGIVWTGTVWLAFSESTNNIPFSYDGIKWIENRSSTFATAINAGVMDGKLSDTIHLATDAYYQTGYKTLTVSTVQSS